LPKSERKHLMMFAGINLQNYCIFIIITRQWTC